MNENKKYTIIAKNNESTVVSEYISPNTRKTKYQSEAELEKEFIKLLQSQAYEYLPITTEKELIENLRQQLEILNNFKFSDTEWKHFFKSKIANPNNTIEEKTQMIQEDFIQLLERDDHTVKNIYLLDKTNIHNNSLQVINQYTPEGGARENRYDVTILVNGLPLVHIELKRRGVDIKEAFNQINRYDRESFWSGSGLFEYIQLFVISNGTFTKYYSNTTRFTHVIEKDSNKPSSGKRSSNSFEFTSWWADATNHTITDLMDFTKTFFSKHAILNILTKYCIFTSKKILLVMRPYQIVATERILGRIETSNNYKKYGKIEGGGYIWHTTGSGKTLTSFKTARLASQLSFIDKVIFVVDRKDLDYQTMAEYDRFEKGAANSNANTRILKKQLESLDAKIIITTIQKLDRFIKKNTNHEIFKKHIVLIFDECHRSQFGGMHEAITKTFKCYHLFGFTGTPIFATNSSSGGKMHLKTTEQAFGDKLHTYTISDAVNDKNVLPFHIEYMSTMRKAENIIDEKVWNINTEKALNSPKRISIIVAYILKHFNQKTMRNDSYKLKERRLKGFNSLFAVASIDAAKLYYSEFQKQMASLPSDKRLKIATIYSFNVNEGEADGIIDDENPEDTSKLDESSRDFLDAAIKDYNTLFQTNFDTSADKFQNYYKDVSAKVKEKELDILIVVNMFLTGFDATTLNTLWVDKNLRLHGLLQAFSRTNRILNSVKTHGNIVCFRNLEEATEKSVALFGDKEASGIVILRKYEDYYNGYTDGDKAIPGYSQLITQLQKQYLVGQTIIGETQQKDFIALYGAILRLKNMLISFDEFIGNQILSERDGQDYQSMYIDLYTLYRKKNDGKSENINDDIIFEIELIKQVEINIDYILQLIHKYHKENTQDKKIITDITKAIDSSIELRNKKDLIEKFIDSLTPVSNVDEGWQDFISKKKGQELDTIIQEEHLNKDETYAFIHDTFQNGYVQTSGTELAKILPPISRFTPDGERTKKKEIIIEKIKNFFNRFYDICSNKDL